MVNFDEGCGTAEGGGDARHRATSGDLETCRRRDDVLDFVLVCSMGLTSLFRPRRGAARSVSAVYSVVNLFNLVVKKKV